MFAESGHTVRPMVVLSLELNPSKDRKEHSKYITAHSISSVAHEIVGDFVNRDCFSLYDLPSILFAIHVVDPSNQIKGGLCDEPSCHLSDDSSSLPWTIEQ
jgi:hypothetical protein